MIYLIYAKSPSKNKIGEEVGEKEAAEIRDEREVGVFVGEDKKRPVRSLVG